VTNKTYEPQIQTNLTNADGTKSFGTPTIVADVAPINWQTNGWLTDLVNTAYQQK